VQAADRPLDRPDLASQFRLASQNLLQEVTTRADQLPGPGPDDFWLPDAIQARGQRDVGTAPGRLQQVRPGYVG
jgi:hypothetical protein